MAIKLERGSDFMGVRYDYDMKLKVSSGWCQVDTRQDASYYGTWANPLSRMLFSFCEGDLTTTLCDTDEDFIQAVNEMVAWNKEAGYWIGIDGMCDETIIARFTELGLKELLH